MENVEHTGRAPKSELMAAVHELALGQDGQIGQAQLNDLGISNQAIRRWAAATTLHRSGPRAFALPGTATTARSRMWAAYLSTPPSIVLAAASAGHFLDLRASSGKPAHLLSAGSRPRPRTGIIVHRTAHLPDADIVEVDGLRCTSTARTLIDVAATATEDVLDSMLDRAVLLRLYDHVAMARVVAERPSFAGAARLQAAVARLDETSGRNRSELERRVIRMVNESDLPAAGNNVMLHGFELDVHWFGTRAIVEADGRSVHSSPQQIAADIEKQRFLERMGFVFLRLTWWEVTYDTERTLARVARFYAQNCAPPAPMRIAP